MGWLWWSSPSNSEGSASAPADTSTSTGNRSFGLTDEQRDRIFGKVGDPSREEQTDKELEAFLNSLSGTESTQPTASKTISSPPREDSQPTTTSPPNSSRLLPDGSVNIHPHALYPRTMTCRHAFDQAFYCQSLGGKFNDIYRFGKVQSCSEQWGAFWFCMRTRALPAPEREEQIRAHYAEREARKIAQHGSSEKIWEMRTEGVRSAFQRDPDAEDRELAVKE